MINDMSNTTSNTSSTSNTIELIIWFEGREKDGYIPFDTEMSEEGDIKIQRALIKPLMYFGSVLASNFGKLCMPKGIEIIDGTEAIYEPELNIMTALMKLNFETVRNEINSDSLIQAFKTWHKEAPYYLIGVSCKNSAYPCPDKCKEALRFDGVDCEDWFVHVRENEPRPQFPLSAWKYNKPKIQINEAGLSWSKKYDQVTGGFKAFAAARKKAADTNTSSDNRENEKSGKEALRKIAINRLQNNDGYPSMTNVPKADITKDEEEHMTVYSFGNPVNHGRK